ncbi:MAG: ferritin-like domain-containing protein [Chloroflexi bacterium]|nr:ferritin-like domain-containing protein [Chloroflexota bacterium]
MVKAETLEMLRKESAGEDLDLSWIDKPAAERGLRVTRGKRGLTLEDISVGTYGNPPEVTRNQSGRMRGSAPRDDAQNLGRHWMLKSESWSDSSMMIYEEALQRQWSSATDIPWEEMPEMDDDLELAMSQLCTFLTQVEFIAGDVPGKFAPNISADHFETGLFLATQIMDEARHLDVFRKRALANGIGLLQAGPGAIGLLTAESFIDMTASLHLVGEGFIQSMFRMGELFAHSEVDKRIFRLAAQDESRHVAFGVMHMKHLLDTEPERKEEVHTYLDRMEGRVGASSTQAGLTGGGDTSEALAILLGGGKDEKRLNEGYKKLMAVRRRQFTEYLHRLEVVGLGDRKERLPERIRAFLDADVA